MNFLHLIRWGNLLIAAAVYVMTCIVFNISLHPSSLAVAHLGQLVMLLSVMAFGNVHNDMHDIKTDRVIKPHRLLVQGTVSIPTARLYVINLLIAAALAAIVAVMNQGSVTLFVWLGAAVVMLWLYNRLLKRLPFIGNVVVAALVASVPLLAGRLHFLHEGTERDLNKWHLFVSMAFLMTLCREMVKDLSDLEGDRAAGFYTLPIVAGTNRAVMLSAALHVIALGVFFFHLRPFLIGHIWQPAIVPILLTIASVLYSTYSVLINDYLTASTVLKLGLIPGIMVVYFL